MIIRKPTLGVNDGIRNYTRDKNSTTKKSPTVDLIVKESWDADYESYTAIVVGSDGFYYVKTMCIDDPFSSRWDRITPEDELIIIEDINETDA